MLVCSLLQILGAINEKALSPMCEELEGVGERKGEEA